MRQYRALDEGVHPQLFIRDFRIELPAIVRHETDAEQLGCAQRAPQVHVAHRILQALVAVVDAAGIEVDTVVYDSFSGVVHELVTQEANKWAAELSVLGTHGRRGIGRLVLGSGAESILRYAPVPVLLVRAANEPAPQPEATVAPTHPSVPAGMVAME